MELSTLVVMLSLYLVIHTPIAVWFGWQEKIASLRAVRSFLIFILAGYVFAGMFYFALIDVVSHWQAAVVAFVLIFSITGLNFLAHIVPSTFDRGKR